VAEVEQPIQQEVRQVANEIAGILDRAMNPSGNKTWGFALMIFPFGQPDGEHRCNYISNADRSDMLATMKEFIARAEGRYHESKPDGEAMADV
jgi:hypothetical protein